MTDTQVDDLAPLARVSTLQALLIPAFSASHNLTPSAGSWSLHTLVVSKTRVTDLRPLAHVPNLQKLLGLANVKNQ